jgi:Flp pilus assembly protein TadG
MARKARHGFWGISQRLWRDDRGATLVLMALTTTVLLAITGLAVDTGWWYTIQRQNQSAADAGALSAAYELLPLTHQAWTAAQLTPFASQAATQNGYAGTAPAVTYPCGSPPCLAQNSGGIQVVLQQPQNTWFAALTGLNSVTITNRAVAKVAVLDNPCMYILGVNSKTGKQNLSGALSITGSATLSSPGCSICVDSNAPDSILLQGGNNAVLIADTIITAGQIKNTGSATPSLTFPAQLGAPTCADPYATGPNALTHSFLTTGMPTTPACTYTTGTATWSGNCVVPGGSIKVGDHLSANTQISGGLSIKNGTVALSAGAYWITDGDLTLQTAGALQCVNCTVILTTAKSSGSIVGAVTLGAQANLSLSAPSSGNFNNLVLIQDSNGLPTGTTIKSPSTAKANASETLNGLVYFPDSDMTFQGGAGGGSCLMIVANSLTLQGNPALSTTGCPTTGPGAKKTVSTVALVE